MPEFADVGVQAGQGPALRPGEDAVRLAHHQGRGQARPSRRRSSTRSRTRSKPIVARKAQADYVTKLRETAKIERLSRQHRPRMRRPPAARRLARCTAAARRDCPPDWRGRSQRNARPAAAGHIRDIASRSPSPCRTVSPLAPNRRPRHAGDRRRAACDRRRRHQLRRPHRRAARAARPGHHRRRACSPTRNARRRRSNGAAPSSRAARRARWWSIPATPTPSPARPAATAVQVHRRSSPRSAVGCKPARRLSRLDRRDRRAAQRAGLRRRDGRPRRSGAAPRPWLDAAKAIMTTDTFPKVATASAKHRQGDGHHQRHRQGRRHDRARHGDHAVVCVHRCADRRAGAADSC